MELEAWWSGLGFKEMTQYHQQEMSEKPFVYCIVADEKKIDKKDLEKLGPVQILDLKTIFGY